MGYNVSLRRREASLIEVISEKEAIFGNSSAFEGTFIEDKLKSSAHKRRYIINVALVGNPNRVKTSLFNNASGSHEKVGNYGGVTVDMKGATIKQDGYSINIVDLPGTYSIT
jgi:ferrous iron transport protein B